MSLGPNSWKVSHAPWRKYRDKILAPQTLSHTIWKHFLHREDKSLGLDATPCHEYTRGLLLRRPVLAMLPFDYIGKEVERRAQEGEDITVLENMVQLATGRDEMRKPDPPILRSLQEQDGTVCGS